MSTVFSALPRDRAGKGAARAVRRTGNVPAVIYGGKQEPALLAVEARAALRLLQHPGVFSSVITLEVSGVEHRVLTRDIQLDAVRDLPIHIDFLRVSDDTQLVVDVGIRLVNAAGSPGVKRGGIPNIVAKTLKVRCKVADLPPALEVDLDGRKLGESMTVKDIKPVPGVEFLAQPTDVVATVAIPPSLRRQVAQEG